MESISKIETWDDLGVHIGCSDMRLKVYHTNKKGYNFQYKKGGAISQLDCTSFLQAIGKNVQRVQGEVAPAQSVQTDVQLLNNDLNKVEQTVQKLNKVEQLEQTVQKLNIQLEQSEQKCSKVFNDLNIALNKVEQSEQKLNKSEQNVQLLSKSVQSVQNELNKSEQVVQKLNKSEQLVQTLRNELTIKDLQIKNALDKSSLPEDLKKELSLLRSENSDLKSEKVRIETELQFQKEKIKELHDLNNTLKLGAINTEHDRDSTSEKLLNLSLANRENLEELTNVKLLNLDLAEQLKIAEAKNGFFESEKSNLSNFVKLLTDKYKGLFVAIGYLSVMSMFIVGKYEYTTFEAIFGYLKIPFASLFALAMIVFFQGRFVDDIGLTCFNIWLYGSKAKTQSEKILNHISIGFGISIVTLMFLTAQRIWNTPPPKAEFDPSLIAKIQKIYELDSTKCAFQFAKDSAKIVDSIGFENQRRNVLKSKIWCNEGCKKTYSDSNAVALNLQRSKLSQADCGLNLRNLESKRDSDIANLKPIAQTDNRFFGLFIYLLFVAIRIVEILVKAIRVKEGVLVAPKRLRVIVLNFVNEVKNRI